MTDQPGVDPEQRLPATRPPADVAPTDRFSAPPNIHSNELSPERAAGIVEGCKRERFRYSPRLHIDLWGDKRGV